MLVLLFKSSASSSRKKVSTAAFQRCKVSLSGPKMITSSITDEKRTVEITIQRWNGSGYDPDWSQDYFNAGSLPYDEEKGAYIVPDVQYCIDMANDTGEEGARCRYDENGDLVPDEDMCVFVNEL